MCNGKIIIIKLFLSFTEKNKLPEKYFFENYVWSNKESKELNKINLPN